MAMGRIFLAGLIITGLCLAENVQTARRRSPIVKQLGRILIESPDPKSLFSFFADTLLIPVAWPITETNGFASAAVGTGNVNIEVFRRTGPPQDPNRKLAGARFAGIAMEPYALPQALREMQVEGIPYGNPQPYISTLPKGTQGVLWTMVTLPSVSGPDMSVFLFEYSSEYLNSDIRGKQLGNRLVLNGGGPLGIHSVSEIVIESADIAKDAALWQQLLGNPASSRKWQVGSGPAIRLTPGTKNGIQSIAFKVESIRKAKEFLSKNRLMGYTSADEISISPSRVQGLNIRLEQRN